MSTQWLLFLHLLGAFLFVSGAVAAAVLRLAALRPEQPGDVALLLRAVRPAVPLIATGLVFVLVFGFWLAHRLGYDLGSSWLIGTFVLLAWIVVVGAVAGRQDRCTRELAERIAVAGGVRDDELARRLRDPVNLALNGSLLVATIALVALMVWRPS